MAQYDGPETRMMLISLFDIIKNSRDKTQHDENQYATNVRETECKFCTLLFDTIALPPRDPFEHPAMKEHMPREFMGKTFESWAKGIKWHDSIKNTAHPFGQGRNRIKFEQDKADTTKLVEIRDKETEAAAQFGVAVGAGAAGAAMHAGAQEKNNKDQIVNAVLGNVGALIAGVLAVLDHKMPVGVAVTLPDKHGILREDMLAAHACNGPPPIPHLSMPPNSGKSRVGETWEGNPVLWKSPFFNEYAKLLEQYTSRDMSDTGDILNGMLGLLKVLENMRNFHLLPDRSLGNTGDRGTQRGDHTLYGLPEEFLDIALLWQPPAVKGTYLTKRSSDVLPSWSWAGWEVSKDPSLGREAGKNPKAHPGVRFEEPFWVSGNDDMTLRKLVATESHAEERFKSLLMWYKCLKKPTGQQRPPPAAKKPTLRSNPAVGNLKPVNGTGIGYLCGSEYEEQLCLNRALKFRKTSIEGVVPPSVPADIPLDNRHLVCETDEAKFRLRKRN
ncbi:hypothetical protein CMUS01_04335 [Colletotrichum musicola]|uniref:Uncharacterized protein n=1 Tax=Colletotrichum musicola TaxID=2175873 RepID=A0A8H6NNI4_9PEZI|nr:hypothetical protein CMUS01_04335 [Colletotrichum musicola]